MHIILLNKHPSRYIIGPKLFSDAYFVPLPTKTFLKILNPINYCLNLEPIRPMFSRTEEISKI